MCFLLFLLLFDDRCELLDVLEIEGREGAQLLVHGVVVLEAGAVRDLGGGALALAGGDHFSLGAVFLHFRQGLQGLGAVSSIRERTLFDHPDFLGRTGYL